MIEGIEFRSAKIEQKPLLGWTFFCQVVDTKSAASAFNSLFFTYDTRDEAIDTCRRLGFTQVTEMIKTETVERNEVTL